MQVKLTRASRDSISDGQFLLLSTRHFTSRLTASTLSRPHVCVQTKPSTGRHEARSFKGLSLHIPRRRAREEDRARVTGGLGAVELWSCVPNHSYLLGWGPGNGIC